MVTPKRPTPSSERSQPEASAEPPEGSNSALIRDLIQDLAAKQEVLSDLIDRLLTQEAESGGTLSAQELGRLIALHSQNASRLGRLLRDRRALDEDAADGMPAGISRALDELAEEWGVEL